MVGKRFTSIWLLISNTLSDSKSYLFLNPLPDDAGHLITIKLNDGLSNLDLGEGSEMSLSNLGQHLY